MQRFTGVESGYHLCNTPHFNVTDVQLTLLVVGRFLLTAGSVLTAGASTSFQVRLAVGWPAQCVSVEVSYLVQDPSLFLWITEDSVTTTADSSLTVGQKAVGKYLGAQDVYDGRFLVKT